MLQRVARLAKEVEDDSAGEMRRSGIGSKCQQALRSRMSLSEPFQGDERFAAREPGVNKPAVQTDRLRRIINRPGEFSFPIQCCRAVLIAGSVPRIPPNRLVAILEG